MGKIVKYCNTCEEGFAEKFAFCPNCASQLQAFEMVAPIGNTYIPQNQKTAAEESQTVADAEKTDEFPAFPFETEKYETETPPIVAAETAPIVENVFADDFKTEDFDAKAFDEQEIVVEEPEFVEENKGAFAPTATTATVNNGGVNYYSNPNNPADDGFYVTVIEEKNGKQRNLLLLGSLVAMTVVLTVGGLYSLFSKDFGIGSIEQQSGIYALIPEVDPVQMEEEPQPKKADDDGGGGGGGGRDEATPVQKGRLADQTRERILIAPDKSITQVTNPAIKIIAQTEGDNKRPITNEPYGLPNATGVGSNGMGRGGGMGSGVGTGMGTGVGTGEGSGIGSGSGSGNGPGNGGGTGVGGRTPPPPPPTAPAKPAVTTALRITSKPKALYTDAARQQNVQGTVTLRVTFNANGTIGSIAAVKGMPYGLTEQAIAAARNIRFEPQLVNGQPKAVTKTLEYNFTMY